LPWDGYGRGTLYPYSDVDVLVLLPDQASDAARARVEELVGVLWDIGLEIGHSVRTIAGCSEEASRDVTVQTTLLESRLVAGNRKLYSSFVKSIEEGLDVPYFRRSQAARAASSAIPASTTRPTT